MKELRGSIGKDKYILYTLYKKWHLIKNTEKLKDKE